MTDQTPMIKQYREIKSQHKDAILFFRLGDFYEMFYDDAELGSRELGLTLTGRGISENRMPMCGIPFHAAENYIGKLVEKGYKVAICEQVEDPKLAKGLVKRDVIKIYTPGTIIGTSMLTDKTNNYLLVVSFEKGKFGLAYTDASTGEFKVTEIDTLKDLLDEINRIKPSEILLSDMIDEKRNREPCLPAGRVHSQVPSIRIESYKDKYDQSEAEEKLSKFFKIKSLASFGIENYSVGLSAAAAALDYLEDNQKTALGHINKITPYAIGQYMLIDAQTRRNLELVQSIKDKSLKGALLWVLDRCETNMGSRLLRNWLLMPLMEIDKINARFDAIDELIGDTILKAELTQRLKNLYDIERLTSKIATEQGNAKDIVSLNESLKEIPFFKTLTSKCKSKMLKHVNDLPELLELKELINKAIKIDPPFTIKEGGIINDSYDNELDELRKIAYGGKSWIAELENKERIASGIKSLKVGFNKVFGYYIEVTTANLSQVPANYIRKQTLTNCERYITPDLKEKESLILNADERIKELEYKIFCDVREKAAGFTKELQYIAEILSQLDVLISLAQVAQENNYCRPLISGSTDILITGSRHPVVEKMLGNHNFVKNDILMNNESSFLLITGPNMAGKSTYMRQTALICLLAQMGSFVPADNAILPLIDKIFTRIGAMDDIYSGQSTFMLEMTETANILNNATENSLIILDEIGRGTATFDGMSIAAAVAEFINNNIKAKTLFATHYHEITQLAEKHKGMKNLNIQIKEEGDQITFLHKIVEGSADRSYGIQVARLAGLPNDVISRAKEIYTTLEMVENDLGFDHRSNVPVINA
ncbi:DNA mismatch repair protein MutS [Candidatus Saganbacteria bacterium]|nr:DNA mismatch repair protein MutS [Candidatus Saganbacteria bacterium]